jgi:hypothetical protein
MSNRFVLEKDRENRVWKLEDKEYHPYVTYNTVVDGANKEYDGKCSTFIFCQLL